MKLQLFKHECSWKSVGTNTGNIVNIGLYSHMYYIYICMAVINECHESCQALFLTVLVKIKGEYLSQSKSGYMAGAFFNSTYLVFAQISLIPPGLLTV